MPVLEPLVAKSLHFKAGGTLEEDNFYIERAADTELPAHLRSGEFCYVLAPRQMGKSSLRYRAMRRLTADGISCVSIDLTALGTTDISPEDWYFGLLLEIQRQLVGIGLDAEQFWERCGEHMSPVHRFTRFLRDELLAKAVAPVVLFVDEIDAVRALPFPSDDFFAAVRATYNHRADDPLYRRLTFCLLGVAQPGDLIKSDKITPFNIGRPINLADFSRAELAPLGKGLASLSANTEALLDSIFHWTCGHPYMTQRLCDALVPILGGQPAANPGNQDTETQRVSTLVDTLFLRRSSGRDPNLAYAEKCFSYGDTDIVAQTRIPKMLNIYGRLLRGTPVPADGRSDAQGALLMSGIAAVRTTREGRRLGIRNNIFELVFNQVWLREQQKVHLFSEPMTKWIESDHDASFLLSGAALRNAEEWADRQTNLSDVEHAFLRSCGRIERERELKERKTIESQLQSEKARWDHELAAAELRYQQEGLARRKSEEAQQELRAEIERLVQLEQDARRQYALIHKASLDAEAALAAERLHNRRSVLVSFGALVALFVTLAAWLFGQSTGHSDLAQKLAVQQAELQTTKDKLSRNEAELDRTRHGWAQLQANLAESRQQQSEQVAYNLSLRKRFEEQLAKIKINYEKNLSEMTDSLIRCQKKRDDLQ